MYSRNLDLCLFVCKDGVYPGGGTFVKREGTTADKLDVELARAHSFEFSSTLFMQESIENIEKKSGKYLFCFDSATIHQGDFSVEQSRGTF